MATRFLLGSFCLFFSILFFNGVFSELPTDQKSAIVELSNALHNQTSSLRWNPHTDPCSWAGVTCSGPSNSSVTGLSLSNLGLAGPSFLPLACKIESLEFLDVSKNSLSEIPVGFFTNCGIIQGLKLLNFSYNRVSGSLPSFKGFSKLEYLDLSHNSFNGSIGFQLDVLVCLKSLNLSFNLFTGSIPINLGKFKSLEMLQLSGNLFSGSIPEELGDCNNLTSIDLSINKLSGNLPASLGELSKLEYLVVSSNKLSGSIPDFLANITTLQRFAANQNMFSGVIPSGVSKHVLNLDLSYNKLLSQIPIDLLSQPNLVHVDLSSNRLVGSIPAKLSQKLFRLRLGSNLLNGTISSLNFAEPQNLTYLELDNNSLSGLIPAELGSCQMLKLLSLAQNKFSGELPQELGNLKQLQVLRLQSNTFSGRIPTEITGLLNLSTLNISWNLLSGTIPPSIVSLKHLVYLHLQGNNLSGPIPDGIGNMSALTELQLGKNSLSGNIPLMPTTLQYALNLSHNLFEGPIPKSLQYLTELEILDLSNNKFDGEIPDFLTRMSSLTTLLLTDNDLSGVAPKFGPNVLLDTNGNLGLINGSTSSTSPVSAHKRTSVAVVVPVAVAAALAGAVVALVVILFTRRYYKVNDVTIQELDEIPPSRSVGGYMLSSSSSHRSNIDFTRAMEAVAGPLNIVLKTRFSTYYRVVMPSGTSYFVKKLNWSDKIFQLGSHENFGQELEALAKLSSSNIMTPLAYMLVSNGTYIFYEFAQKGSLFDVLHGSSETNLDWASRYSIAVGVAQGLAFLHGCSSGPILLLDLTSRNIMLKSLKEPQVGDIELCKVIDPSKSTSSLSALAGSVGYIPPEYAYTMRITMAGNVYSFGVILLELVTGKQAVSEGTELAKWVLSNSSQQLKWNHLLDFTVGKKSPAVRNQMVAVLKIALACVSVSSEARPKMKSVLRMLLNVR